MKKSMLGLLAASVLSSSAFAQTGYIGADFSFISAEVSVDTFVGTYSEDVDPTALRLRGGVELNQNFAIEGVLGMGLQDDEIDTILGETEVGLDTLFGVTAVGIIPLDRNFSLFGKVGFASVEYQSDDEDYSIDDTGVSFGFGGKVNFNRNGSGLIVEYTFLPDVEDEDTDIQVESEMLSVGAQFAF